MDLVAACFAGSWSADYAYAQVGGYRIGMTAAGTDSVLVWRRLAEFGRDLPASLPDVSGGSRSNIPKYSLDNYRELCVEKASLMIGFAPHG